MILHTVNKASSYAKCRNLIADADALALLEDGVYLCLGSEQLPKRLYALQADLEARGLANRLPKGTKVVDYRGLVRLATEADKVCNWF